jgi:CBS domain containing-hemolysin-like protein
VLRITADPPQFIAAMQLGVTLTSLGIGAVGEQALSHAFDRWISTVLAVLLAFLILSFAHVVIGELVPKGLALGHAEGTALWVSAPVRAFFTLFAPFVWALRRTTEGVLHLLGLESPGAERDPLSEAELRMLLSRSSEEGEIELEEQQMIDKVFVFGDKDAADVMVPRPEVAAVSVEMPPEQALATVLDSPYTRYPVFRESLDDVIGVLHVRDLFTAVHDRGLADVKLEEIVRPAYIVPETKDLASLLQEFRRTNNHFAVVVDEYGGTAGLVTIEDIIEEIVGEIADEYDREAPGVEDLGDGTYRVPATMDIDDLADLFDVDIEEEEVDTVGGLIGKSIGRVPIVGSRCEVAGLSLTAERMAGRRHRIASVIVERVAAAHPDGGPAVSDEGLERTTVEPEREGVS